jgi:predicted nucleic acid-binding protein
LSLVLDAGALLAVEREDREVMALVKHELRLGRAPRTHGGVVGQAWRSASGRQARLGRFLTAVDVAPLDRELGRRAGILLGRARMADVIDAALVMLAADGDVVLTSDPHDIGRLASAAGVHADIVRV